MICPYCNSELKFEDTYYRGKPGGYVNGGEPYPIGYYSEPSSNYKVLGDIYHCPNSDGFEDVEEKKLTFIDKLMSKLKDNN